MIVLMGMHMNVLMAMFCTVTMLMGFLMAMFCTMTMLMHLLVIMMVLMGMCDAFFFPVNFNLHMNAADSLFAYFLWTHTHIFADCI